MLIVGEPGSGKSMAAYSLIEYLDNTEGDERIPLLVNLSAWEALDEFRAFLVDYLCSSVGYEVTERSLAKAFVDTGRYSLILDGLDEIPVGLREHFSERLDEFVRGLQDEVGVVVTCRTQEYEQLLAAHSTGLGLVQAVEILPLTKEQLDSAFAELAKHDKNWETFLSQQHHTAYKRVRELLSNPLFLNLAVVGHLSPGQLLDWSTSEQELRDLVLDSYLDRTLANQRNYEAGDARRYLSWIARFLNGDEVSPFGLKETDFTVFDLADLTPPEPPRRYRLVGGLIVGLVYGLVLWLALELGRLYLGFIKPTEISLRIELSALLFFAVPLGVIFMLSLGLPSGWPVARSALSSQLTFIWPSTRRRILSFLRRAGSGLILGLGFGVALSLVLAFVNAIRIILFGLLIYGSSLRSLWAPAIEWLPVDLALGIIYGSSLGLLGGGFLS
jgi:NACHT domain